MVTALTGYVTLWLISTNGDGLGLGSLGRRSVPKMGNLIGKLSVQGSESNSEQVEKVVHNTM